MPSAYSVPGRTALRLVAGPKNGETHLAGSALARPKANETAFLLHIQAGNLADRTNHP